MNILTIKESGISCNYREGESLLDILQGNGAIIESPCGGKGYCGKCKVQILDGDINGLTEEELKHLSKKEIDDGIRLSCLVYPKGPIQVKLLNKEEKNYKGLSDGYTPEIILNPLIHKQVIKLEKPTLENNISYEEVLERAIGSEIIHDNIGFLKALADVHTSEEATLVYWDDKPIGIESGDTKDKLYGAAVDIGTTTVVVSLIDLNTGTEIESETSINPQKEYGLDVLSRIDFVKRKENGLYLLQKAIVDCINSLLEKLCNKNNIDTKNIYEIAVGANATMMHLLLGIDTITIGKSPYATIFSKEKNIWANSIGLRIAHFGRLYCLPGVSSFIGADIVAGAVVSGLKHTKDNVFFIDIGTNGEMILSKGGKLASCSCAAGPALEGANISCGMRAAEGAIEGIQFNEDGVSLQIIGDGEPVGICGSGILEAMAELNKKGLIKKSGRLKKKEDLESEGRDVLAQHLVEEDKKRKVIICKTNDEVLSLSQEDIRQVQLAKGAISSGFYALVDFMGMDMEDLDSVVIAGQFGRHLKISSLTGVGIIPENLKDKINYIGNSSKTGAMMCLMSKDARKEMEDVAKDIEYFELSTKEGYEKLFTKCLTFR
ncbi:ASKHA domain-containing protein [Anaerosalibacter sp. Marseille-P3206]|uniref:ASKHA domain-containing protein n=1 Tax=Anaerosalibacter sp. Marseille-P3206 TaxID=1871005 RepID=UPI0009858B46|nr:ASKHA domain-containing protein [Anaerosalibacter sp. Marseille-P3206]